MAHENKIHVWPNWCTNPVIDPTGAYRTRDGQCQWCGGTHFGSGVCPYSPAYKEPEIKTSVAHEKGTEIPEEVRKNAIAYWLSLRIGKQVLIPIGEISGILDLGFQAGTEIANERISALTLENERLENLNAAIACAMASLLPFDKISAIQANVEEVTKARRLERSTPWLNG